MWFRPGRSRSAAHIVFADGRIVSLVPESAATKDRPARKGDAIFLPPDMFAQRNDSYFKTNGFFERSIAKRVEEFGNLV